jgi:hypothetical protein
MEYFLLKNRFKQKWFEDKSGYWFIYNFKLKKIPLRLYCESDNKILELQVKVKTGMGNSWETVRKYKCSKKQIKKLINKLTK